MGDKSKIGEEMKAKKRLVYLYTRINGVERTQVAPELKRAGFTKNLDFHKSLGLNDKLTASGGMV